MLTPSRKSRRSILTPARSNSRNASPAPAIEKPQIISETPQYQLLSVPHSTHALARDALRRKHVTAGGVRGIHAWITEGNRVIVWPVGGVRVYELPLPTPALNVHLLEEGRAVVVTVKGEVMRWNSVEQTQRYTVLQDCIPVQVVHSAVSNGTVLVLDANFGVWCSEGDRMVKRTQPGAIQGISRRVSSMFWSDPTTQLGSALKVVNVGDHTFSVGTQGIQRTLNGNVLWSTPLAPLIADIFSRDSIAIIPQSVCIRDAICSEESLVGLATVSSASENLHIFIFYLNSLDMPDKVDGLIDLEVEGEGDFTDLLIIDNCDKGYVYSKSNVSSIDLSTGSVLDLQLPDCSDIIALGSLGDRNVVFTKQGGMIKIIMKDVKVAVSNLNIVEGDEDLFSVVEKKFHGAFKCFLEFNETQNQAKLEDILGCDDSSVTCKIVYETAKYLLTAAPAADPRWGGDGADLPVTIGFQIDERCRRLKGLISFMERTSYWETLCESTVDDVCVAGYLLQCVEQALVGAVFYANNSELLARAVRQCASVRTNNDNAHLAPEDIFYSQLEYVDELFKALAQHQNSVIREQQQVDIVVKEMFSSVKVVQQALDGVYHFREDHKAIYQAALLHSPYTWLDNDELRTIVAAQYHIAMDTVLPEINEDGRYQVLVVCASLAESLLTAYSTLIALLPSSDNHTAALIAEYERRRHSLISPFVELKVYQIAFSLSEQFQYLTLLVQLCEETGDINRLKALSNKHQGFAEVAYQWYLSHGKQSTLLTSGIAEPAQLAKFLAPHSHLSWIHHLGRKDYTQAGQALKSLGEAEQDLLSRKKTLLSIGKLALLAGGTAAEDIGDINRQLDTVTFQERMKPEIIENSGLDPERMAPVQTSDLITMCIGPANPQLEDLDIKKALDLLHALAEDESVSNEEFEKMRLDIWVAAISKDDWWKQCTLSSPEQMDSTLFYRAVILAHNSGLMISSLIPPVDALLSVPAWGEVFGAQHKQFEYLLRSGYEQMAQLGVMS